MYHTVLYNFFFTKSMYFMERSIFSDVDATHKSLKYLISASGVHKFIILAINDIMQNN